MRGHVAADGWASSADDVAAVVATGWRWSAAWVPDPPNAGSSVSGAVALPAADAAVAAADATAVVAPCDCPGVSGAVAIDPHSRGASIPDAQQDACAASVARRLLGSPVRDGLYLNV